MSIIRPLGQTPYRIDPTHVTHITKEISTQIHHDALSGLQQRTIGASGQRRIHSFTSQGKVIRAGSRCIVARQHASHEDFHTPPKDAEDTQASFQTHQALNFDRKGPVGHTLHVHGRDPFVRSRMGRSRTAE